MLNQRYSLILAGLSLAGIACAQATPAPDQTGLPAVPPIPVPRAPKSSEHITLARVLDLAITRNGTIASAYSQYLASRESTIQSFAAFLPTVTPQFVYNSDRTQAGGQFFQTEGSNTTITASYRILDLGDRNDRFLSARRSEDSQFANARQTLRQTLFNVEQQYIETLRAQELESVALASAQRTQEILKQTIAGAETGNLPKIQTYQAQADYANARVQVLQSEDAITTNAAQLKGLIGLPADEPLPTLTELAAPDLKNLPNNLDALLVTGIQNRPDLIAQRLSVQALKFDEALAKRQAGINFTVDASFSETYNSSRQEARYLTLTASYPLFDGGASRSAARQVGYQVQSAEEALIQAERTARAEIEAAYRVVVQDADRLSAAQDALTAAQQNYDAAKNSYDAGASTLIDVLTAQVSLVTAQSNLITATYDFDESKLSLELATGQHLEGEPIGDFQAKKTF